MNIVWKNQQRIDLRPIVLDLMTAADSTRAGAEAGTRTMMSFLDDLSEGRHISPAAIITMRQNGRVFLDALDQQRLAINTLREGLK